ncbi:MAG: Lrp/AsnC ligand binding domain-containing protein [Flavobacteriaceae bacterium]|jgi:Lrp/AsnC family transcriptional regulator for asnA, asnC and gidA|nr:Lrp/AsnC ligand binding domain-containing protein [Flavobacteriaceae bacterium]
MNYQLDVIDKKILDFLVKNTRMPFTEIAKKIDVSAGTIHVRVKKMEDAGIVLGSSLDINYTKLDFHFTAYIGILLTKSNRTQEVLKELAAIPNVIEISVISGKYNIFCKVRAKNTDDAKKIIYQIDDIQDVMRTESMICMEEYLSDKNRVMKAISI